MLPKTQNRLQFLINTAYYAAVIVLVYLGFKYVLGWILPFIVAFCIVSIINPVIQFVNNKLKINHKAASVIVMIMVYGLTGFLLFELIIQSYYVLRQKLPTLPAYYEANIAPAFTDVGVRFDQMVGELPGQLPIQFSVLQQDLMGTIRSMLVGFSQRGMEFLTQFAGQIPSFLIAFVFTIMLSFFISMRYTAVATFINSHLPPKAQAIYQDFRQTITTIIFRYLGAIAKLVTITFVELSIGLLILGIPNAIGIAVLIAFFDALPILGTGAIVVPWAIIELLRGHVPLAIGLLILYAIVYVVRNIIEPHVVGKKLGLDPIVSIVCIYLGFKVFGVFGMILMPIATQILLEMYRKGAIRLFGFGRPTETEMEAEAEDGPPASDTGE